MTPENRPKRNLCLRSLLFLTAGRLLVLASVLAFMGLASTLNAAEGLGVASLVVCALTQLTSTLLFATYLARRFGCRSLVRLGLFFYLLYILANIYPTWGTLIPGAMFVGLGSTLQLSGCNLYVTELSEALSSATGAILDVVIVRSFALITIAMQSGHLWGNLLNAAILTKVNGNISETTNATLECGSSYCGGKEQTLPMPPQYQLNILSAVLSSLAIGGCLLTLFLGEFSKKKKQLASFCGLLKDTLTILIDRKMLLLTPLSFYVGLQISFIIAGYTEGFIGCTLGISQIGKVMICFGAADAITSILQTLVARLLGRTVILMSGLLVQAISIVVMLLWSPDASNPTLLYVLAVAWGFSDSILFVQVFSYFSILFPTRCETANVANLFWHAIGNTCVCAMVALVCYYWTLVWLLVVLLVSVTCYCILQFQLKRQRQENQNNVRL